MGLTAKHTDYKASLELTLSLSPIASLPIKQITDPAHHQDDHYQSQPCSRYTHTVSFPILWNLSMRSVHHCLYASSIDHSIHCRFYSVRCINSKHQLEFGNGTNSETHWTIRQFRTCCNTLTQSPLQLHYTTVATDGYHDHWFCCYWPLYPLLSSAIHYLPKTLQYQ